MVSSKSHSPRGTKVLLSLQEGTATVEMSLEGKQKLKPKQNDQPRDAKKNHQPLGRTTCSFHQASMARPGQLSTAI